MKASNEDASKKLDVLEEILKPKLKNIGSKQDQIIYDIINIFVEERTSEEIELFLETIDIGDDFVISGENCKIIYGMLKFYIDQLPVKVFLFDALVTNQRSELPIDLGEEILVKILFSVFEKKIDLFDEQDYYIIHKIILGVSNRGIGLTKKLFEKISLLLWYNIFKEHYIEEFIIILEKITLFYNDYNLLSILEDILIEHSDQVSIVTQLRLLSCILLNEFYCNKLYDIIGKKISCIIEYIENQGNEIENDDLTDIINIMTKFCKNEELEDSIMQKILVYMANHIDINFEKLTFRNKIYIAKLLLNFDLDADEINEEEIENYIQQFLLHY